MDTPRFQPSWLLLKPGHHPEPASESYATRIEGSGAAKLRRVLQRQSTKAALEEAVTEHRINGHQVVFWSAFERTLIHKNSHGIGNNFEHSPCELQYDLKPTFKHR